MFIKCWGSRGSIPVSGSEYVRYGGDTTCLEIRAKSDDLIIVDAGTGIRRLGNKLVKEGLTQFNILFTHAHWDHLMGFPFFKPLFVDDVEIKAFKRPFPGSYVEDMIQKILASPNFPVKYSDLSARIIYEDAGQDTFQIGSVRVEPIHLSHPNGGNGYKFIEGDKTFVFLTDNELGFIHPGGLEFEAYREFSEDADLLIHDAEYTPEEYHKQIEWGHSSYAHVLDLASKANVKKLGLFHLNQERTDDEMDEIIVKCQKIISEGKHPFDCFAVGVDMEFSL
jgi:phosphoribosyl 1,2-cyclic phosphodiesterase